MGLKESRKREIKRDGKKATGKERDGIGRREKERDRNREKRESDFLKCIPVEIGLLRFL